jgi:hypothetical protein
MPKQIAFEPTHADWLSRAYSEAQRRYAGSRGSCDPITAEVIAHRIADLARGGEADFERIIAHSLSGADRSLQ